MISERDRHVALEVQHNVIALDAESVYSWANAGDETTTRQDRIDRFREGAVLMMWKLEAAEYGTFEQYRIDGIREELQFAADIESIKGGIEQQAREKVRKIWTHTA